MADQTNNLQWLQALQWFCQYFGLNAHQDVLTKNLPVVDESFWDKSLFLRACENQQLLFDCQVFKGQGYEKTPLLIEYDNSLLVLLAIESGQAQLQTLDNKEPKTLTVEKLINSPCISIWPKVLVDKRSQEHFENTDEYWLISAIKEVKPWYRDLLLASFLVNILALVIPLFTMNVYDRVVPNAAFNTLWVLATGAFIVIVFDWLLRHARTHIGDIAGKQIDKKISALLFSKMLGMQLEHRPQSAAAFSKQVQDFDSVREFFTSATLVSAIDLPFTLLFLGLMAWLGGYMVFIPLTIMLILIGLAFYLRPELSQAIDESSKLSTQRQAHLLEQLNSLVEIKQLNGEASAQTRWEQLVDSMADWQIKSRQLSNNMSHSIMSLQQLNTVLLIIAGVYLIFAGSLSMGGLIAIVMLSGRAGNSINQLAMLLLRYHQSKTAMLSVEAVLALPQEQAKAQSLEYDTFSGSISCNNISFTYPEQKHPVLQNISLELKPGEKIAIVGRAGAGKSTLLALLAGQYQSFEGHLLYDKLDSSLWPKKTLRRNIGWVSQAPSLLFGSIISNLASGVNAISKDSLQKAIEQSGMQFFLSQLPDTLETSVGEGGRFLSGGQRQSVALARALLPDPSLLILDEPTAAMDKQMQKYVRQQLKIRHGAMIIATHDPELIQCCDKMLVLEQGRIIQRKALDVKHEKVPAKTQSKVNIKASTS